MLYQLFNQRPTLCRPSRQGFAADVRCWFAPHDIQGGRKIHEQIGEAIRVYDRLLLILSEHSMNSEWVKTEIAHAQAEGVD